MLKIGMLDQSTVTEGSGPREALQTTTRLAIEADKLGYSRFWVSEHHSSKALAHSSPEVLIAHLAANTSRIRLGSGGIMLPITALIKSRRISACLKRCTRDVSISA